MHDQLSRVRRLTTAEWAVVIHTVLLVPIAALAHRVCRLERAIRVVAAVPLPSWLPPRAWSPRTQTTRGRWSPPGEAAVPPARIARLATSVATRLGAACLTRAIVLQSLLTRRGVPTVLVIGAARDDRQIRAHAWVEHDGRVVSTDGARGFLPLCRVDGHGITRRVAAA